MITLFCIRPRGFNIGNEAIFTAIVFDVTRQAANATAIATK